MSAKALRKQLIAAVVMVLVAAFATVAYTFAWFASNNKVTVDDMTISAESDTIFLQIKGVGGTVTTGTIVGDGRDFGRVAGVTMTDVKIYPTAHEAGMDEIRAVKDAPNEADSKFWYYGYSDTTTSAAMNVGTKTVVKDAKFHDYVAEITYQVKINNDSGTDASYDLFVKSISIPENKGITAIVAGQNRFQEFNAAVADNEATAVSLSDTVTKTAQTLTVYLYFDGNNEYVRTNNIEQLSDAVSLELSCYSEDTIGVTP